MARSLSERLHDQIVAHEIDLKRFEASDRLGVLAFLDALRDRLVADVARVAPSDPARLTDRRRRLEALLVSIDTTIKNGFKDLTKQERSLMVGLADMEQKWAAQSVNRALRVDVASVSPSVSTLKTLVNDTLLEGTPWQNTWNGIGVQARRSVAQEIRIGVAAGETTPDIARRIRGTRAAGFSDGVWRKVKNQSMTLVRTQVQAISNQAREDAYKEQGNLVKGLQWVATLDLRTSLICQSLDGKVWELETKKPVGHSRPWPGPTAHPNCRSTQIAITRSFDEFEKAEGVDVEKRFRRKLGEQWDKNPRLRKRTTRETFISRNFASARASMDGQVSASIKFPEWLRQKDREQPGFVDRLLGKERGKLWRTGKASIQQMVDQTNRPLTLPELAKKALK